MRRAVFYVPVGCFVLVALLLAWSFTLEDASKLPSVLIDRPFPSFEQPTVLSGDLKTEMDLKGQPALVNVWATWCIACRVEHPFLMQLKNESVVTIYGLNYKDNRTKALSLLERDGDPYEFSIYDFEGRLAIDLGVYGAPETFFVDKNGVIRERHVGVIDETVWEKKFAKYLNE